MFCFDRKFSIIATITISDDMYYRWVIIKSFLGLCLFSIHLLTYQMIYSRFDPFFIFVLSTTNKIKINDEEPKGNGSLLLAISWTWLNSLARSITTGITKRFLLKKCWLSSEVHWGRSEWAVPYLAFCELQIDYRGLSKKKHIAYF